MKRLCLLLAAAFGCTGTSALAGDVDPFTPPPMAPPVFAAATFNVKDFGAIGDGATNDTSAINAAIEKYNAGGGGTVMFPAGHYAATSIHLKSDVTLENITATDCQPGRQGPVFPSTISGRPESSLENIMLENVKITYPGGGTADQADIVPPYPKDYSPCSLGPRPAAAFYVRHVKGLTLRNVQVSYEADDQRPPLVMSDVDGLTLDHFISTNPAGVTMTKFTRVKDVVVKDSPGLENLSAAN